MFMLRVIRWIRYIEITVEASLFPSDKLWEQNFPSMKHTIHKYIKSQKLKIYTVSEFLHSKVFFVLLTIYCLPNSLFPLSGVVNERFGSSPKTMHHESTQQARDLKTWICIRHKIRRVTRISYHFHTVREAWLLCRRFLWLSNKFII